MPNDASEFDLDEVNFSKYISPIISIVGPNYKIGKWLYNLTEQRNLMMTAVGCREIREIYLEEAMVTETFLECLELKWASILIECCVLSL